MILAYLRKPERMRREEVVTCLLSQWNELVTFMSLQPHQPLIQGHFSHPHPKHLFLNIWNHWLDITIWKVSIILVYSKTLLDVVQTLWNLKSERLEWDFWSLPRHCSGTSPESLASLSQISLSASGNWRHLAHMLALRTSKDCSRGHWFTFVCLFFMIKVSVP